MHAEFDAIVLAESPSADGVVAGLTLRERGRRVADRAGARRVLVVEDRAAVDLASWWRERPAAALLVIRAGDQMVHTPLVAPLVATAGASARAVAVSPAGDGNGGDSSSDAGDGSGARGGGDHEGGAYAGALWAEGDEAAALAAALDADADDRALAATWRAAGARAVAHGDIACHPAATAAERRAATKHLCQIIHKSQDGPVTRYLYRPISLPLTRLLLRTPVTPNQVSIAVAVIGLVGIYFTAQREYASVILGTAIVLAAAYLDGCDGEIARFKLRTSKLGAWLDTVIDEGTTVLYMAALGWHVYLRHPEPWIGASIAVGVAASLITIYIIYYYLIVVAGSANSQDYVGRTQIVTDDAGRATVRPRPAAPRRALPPALETAVGFIPHIIRRDFVNWGAMIFAVLHLTQVAYGIFVVVASITALVLIPDHIRLRRQLRQVATAA